VEPKPKPTVTLRTAHMCVRIPVHSNICRTQHSTEQFWQSSLLSSRQSQLLSGTDKVEGACTTSNLPYWKTAKPLQSSNSLIMWQTWLFKKHDRQNKKLIGIANVNFFLRWHRTCTLKYKRETIMLSKLNDSTGKLIDE